ncbi:MAG: hypothetical protein M1546_24355 [Chloroflexi bacterium]|nr:hypothetical protein [Chloroflexota bacterium]
MPISLGPRRHRDRADLVALAHHVHDGPSSLALLEVGEGQLGRILAAQPVIIGSN